jgi:diguanylate cyclase (GGDEF)-like protein
VFGGPARVRRPVLLLLVFGVFLVIVGVTATAQTVIVTANVSASSIDAVVESDAAVVRAFANLDLHASDLDPAATSESRRATVEHDLATLVSNGQILHLEVRRPDGLVLLSNAPASVGQTAELTPGFLEAVGGRTNVLIAPPDGSGAVGVSLTATGIVREYFPIRTDQTGSQVVAIVGIWRDEAPILGRVDSARTDVVVATLSAALIAALVLFLVFRSSQGRINRQTEQLIEAARRDPLTNALNHGTLVGLLAEMIEDARAAGSTIGVAILDIDEFRLLNDTHGHAAGDQTLLLVVDKLAGVLPTDAQFGRYGPDEFLVMVPGRQASDLQPAVDHLRAVLAGEVLQFGDSEPLPVTISAGICTFPHDGRSLSAILACAAVTLQRARASGGDAVRLADADPDAAPETRTFDVFQGLVLAVDTKDRYTKRHSEDVARYSVFLAERMGLDEDTIATIRVAGLLHDVGKIGTPDTILRKPGRLSEAEVAVVHQHVALGDMILRDLPGIDVVRAGVRYHHERWDGAGYLAGLSGDEIPLVARILAVGDAFSAMTTDRPYRKACGVREALVRLADAAGSQLDEDLVSVFLTGIEHDPAAPMPGGDGGHARLWTPYARVA